MIVRPADQGCDRESTPRDLAMTSSLTFSLQALLARHEAYMADAERDRLDLTGRIERLEMDKQQLEAENASKIEENRNLLDQLEMLNTTVFDSDAAVKTLEASLLSSQQAVRRLESAAARASDAERHLAMLEEDQDRLHGELRASREDARSHAQRWKEARRGILDMQDQLERIEKEARQERDRHAEVLGRMERQHELEKQLDNAAGRLKGAAASKSLQTQKSGGTSNAIVNHFVRDLLQDNANLQLGVAELREMLMNSNDEIQSLREQLLYHQPMIDQGGVHTPTTLQAELEPQEPTKFSQELHIHHHYHVTPKQDKGRPKKKRHGLTPAVFSPPTLSHPSSPVQSGQWRLTVPPAAPALLSQSVPDSAPIPTLSMPPGPRSSSNRTAFSNPPSEFASSVPSSPRSHRRQSVFDNPFTDSDMPTSPSSYGAMSPTWFTSHSKKPSEASTRSFQTFASLDLATDSPTIPQPIPIYADDTIQEEDEDGEHGEEAPGWIGHATSTEDSTAEDSEFSREDDMQRPRLHRAMSHESIMSLTGGLDIHTLKARPSQMTLRPLGGAEAIVSGVNAQPILSRASSKRSDAALRDTFAGFQTPRSASNPGGAQFSGSTSLTPATLGKWVGWRPWVGSSAAPAASASAAAAAAAAESMSGRDRDWGRPTGINQAGSIPGFQEYWASQKRKGAPARVNAETIDRDALVEGLQG